MENQEKKIGFNGKLLGIWLGALVIGAVLGLLKQGWLNELCDFIASIYTRLFQFVAVPTIALAVTTTLAMLGAKKNTGKIFVHTLRYTVTTTLAASLLGAALYLLIAPGNLPVEMVTQGQSSVPENLGTLSFYGHILNVIPNNVLTPFSSSNVLSILLVATAVGLALAVMKGSENIQVLTKAIFGLQELFFSLIKALVWALPLGIVAFAAQLSAQLSAGVAVGSIGKYVAVVLLGNFLQFFVVLPLFLLCNRINPLKHLRNMLPAVLMALFTKSSAATLPVNVASAENNLKVKPQVARFILPICCTINMNGCASFILVTSLFLLQNGGVELTIPTILLWVLISVISAIGNAGVPMGCYFLTMTLMTGMNAPIGILGIILPIYTIIDMVETGINVYSDSCICAIVDKKLSAADVE